MKGFSGRFWATHAALLHDSAQAETRVTICTSALDEFSSSAIPEKYFEQFIEANV